MKKRLLAFVCTFCMVATLLAGCGSSDKQSATSGTSAASTEGTSGETYELTLSVPDPDTSSIGAAAKELADRLNEKSGGALKVTTYCNGSLYGGDTAAGVKQLSAGGLDMLIISTLWYASFNPNFNVLSVPYMFDDVNQLGDFLNSDDGKALMGSVDELGVKHIGSWTRSFRQITNSVNPINEPSDLDGIKLRVPSNPLWVEFFTACGANCTPMSFSEVYNALQLKTIQGQENPVDVPVASKFFEVQNYLSMTGHMSDAWLVGMNPAKFDSLPEDLQELILSETAEMQSWKLDYDAEQDGIAVNTLAENGMEVNELSDENREKFAKIADGLTDTFREVVENDELFDATLAFVGK